MDDIALREKANLMIKLSQDYEKERMSAAKNRLKFRLILASKLTELRQAKANAGIDTLELMLLEEGDKETLEYYRAWHYHENKYKGLEKIIEAIKESLHLEKFLGRIE